MLETPTGATSSEADIADFPAYRTIEGDPAAGLILICDHASNRLPASYGGLGVDLEEFDRHIGYDIGAGPVTEAMARRLGVPAVLSGFSRLLIDPNRGEDDPTLIMRLSDGTLVPGNRHIDTAERQRRIERYYRPYHSAIDAAVEAGLSTGRVPAILSIHSFTPIWRGHPRAWQIGILWDNDPRLPRPLIEALAADHELTVGDNEPYSGALANDTMFRHATRRGLPHALVELRQDLIASDAGAEAWATRLADIWTTLAGRDELGHIRHYGSRSGPVPAGPTER